VVRVDVAVVERPAGDRYLNGGLWEFADEQAVDLERKSALEDNGFRVGLIGGILPADLLALLTSDRSCGPPRRIQVRAGNPAVVALGPQQARCAFTLQEGGRAVPVALEEARCELEVVPTPAEGGRMTLRFTPVIRHGATGRELRPVRDPSGEHRWDLEAKQPTETYASLAWEVTVTPEEYVVVGARLDRDDTPGQCFFLEDGAARLAQRLVVIRTGRMLPDAPAPEPGGGAPPLALQAGWRSARGAAPAGDGAAVLP
jgi:hypothetical protein